MAEFPELGLPVRLAYEDDGSAKSKFIKAVDDLRGYFRKAGTGGS